MTELERELLEALKACAHLFECGVLPVGRCQAEAMKVRSAIARAEAKAKEQKCGCATTRKACGQPRFVTRFNFTAGAFSTKCAQCDHWRACHIVGGEG